MRIAYDMSSVMWTCLLASKDAENGTEVEHEGRKVWVNSAEYGYENAINSMQHSLSNAGRTPKDAILVFEGRDSKRKRCAIEPTYKANRDSGRPPLAYEQFNRLKEMLWNTYGKLGAISVSQGFVEGDDMLAWLAANTEDRLQIITNDNDLIVLDGVNAYGATTEVIVGGNEPGFNKYGAFDVKLVTLYKSLVGDSSDNIKGCPGFGKEAWFKFIMKYDDDGAHELMELIRTGNRDAMEAHAVRENCKLLAKIVDKWEETSKSYKLAMLHPEWVNTVQMQPDWRVGMTAGAITDERLNRFRGQVALVGSHNFEACLEELVRQLKVTDEPAFDIETSTPEESDDWLEAQGDIDGVDQIASYLCGFSITFGRNMQYTYYVSVKHADSDNITMVQARHMIEQLFHKYTSIQNTNFELVVLYGAQDEDGTYWRDHWKDEGEFGFMPRVRDTKVEASYVDENERLGLKDRSLMHLGYKQASYNKTMTVMFTDNAELSDAGKDYTIIRGVLPWQGGRVISQTEDAILKRYKMHEVPARHVLSYGADDTICTAALHNFYKLQMQLDHHWHVYLDVEIDALYIHAKNYFDGVNFSVARSKELEAEDDKVYDAAWTKMRGFLIQNGWDGTVPPVYTPAITCKEIKEAYVIVNQLAMDTAGEDDDDEGPVIEVVQKDPILSSRVRTPSKMPALLRAEGHELFAKMVEECIAGEHEKFTAYVRRFFTGDPVFKFGNKHITHLMYEVMGLPIRVRGKATDTMKAKGIFEGNPKGNALAIAYAMVDANEGQKEILMSLRKMTMVKTRRGLYYSPYPKFVHWKTGKIHPSHNQAATNTRRASGSKPNFQQLPKNEKIEGEPPEFRSTVLPHKKGAVVVSMDFKAQELRLIADYSQDAVLLSCYVGDNLKDVHCLTGLSIASRKEPDSGWSYETFVEAVDDDKNPHHRRAKKFRGTGKTVNFATEFGAQADKLSETMMISKEEAQLYIDLREETFARAKEWKEEIVEQAGHEGEVRTMLGAVRHLKKLLNSDDRYIASKADRQAVNFKIQGSGAEMTKKAEGRVWREGIVTNYDAVCIGAIHDELVVSMMIQDLPVLIPLTHKCMVAKYANMQVPIESSISFGRNFKDQIEIGSEPTLAAIQKGLAKMEAQV